MPDLWDYEVTSALFWLCAHGELTRQVALEGLRALFRLNLRHVPASAELCYRASLWAERLGRQRAYDSQYIALAEMFQADFYTADKKLFGRSREERIGFVKLLE
ncbi:MAG: type II toxin-antitoxin system VapC family toxin [Anaerolineales bacterium]|nr:type II toxin-antitoxin system VapC family toxin [Anaerolineales bacterium]MDW8161592.1 type II toxin-antitoxin system VapC family toxin [Anaerolineales bacterium]